MKKHRFEHNSIDNLERVLDRIIQRASQIVDAINQGTYLYFDFCGNCGGAGWTFKNGLDCQTKTCTKCKRLDMDSIEPAPHSPVMILMKYNRNPPNRTKLPYGRYLVVRKDGKRHLETYNGTGWAYNDNAITHYYTPKVD